MTALLDVALGYIAKGWSPVPIPWRAKGPGLSGWQHLKITAEAAPRFFKADKQNLGIILGPFSSDLVDVDLDAPEALRTASYFLQTTCMFGRASTPAAHWLFVASGFSFDRGVRNFDDPLRSGKKARLVELRVGGEELGIQTVFPPSVHESGEEIRWESGSLAEPVRVDGRDLEARVCRLAAAALAARYWPAEGKRHNTAQALGGALRRAGWDTPQIKLFVDATVHTAGDPEPRDRMRAALDAAAAVDADSRAYGLPKLAEALGDAVVNALDAWLGLSSYSSFSSYRDTAAAVPPAGVVAPAEPSWPDLLDPAAMHGLAGDVVRIVAPHSEADPLAILMQFLTAFGACCGRTSYAMAEADRHPPAIWPIIVGASSRGRKGTSWGHVQAIFECVQPPGWTTDHFVPGGLSSGEGIIWAVRDPVTSRDKKSGQESETDPGVRDKRLLVVEAEFANVLRQFERAGNTLSATLRSFWDRGTVRSLTKNSPAKTTGAHVCVIGHITQDELLRYLDRTELANGFANRLLFTCVKRSRRLPFGGTLQAGSLDDLTGSVRARLDDVARAGERKVCFTRNARKLWAAEYDALSEDRPGLYGAVTARAEAQVLRLSLLYALLDETVLAVEAIIDVPHLQAALALWRHCDASASSIFGRALGDPVADEIHRALQQAPLGMTRWDVTNHFGRNRGASAIGRALALLLQHGLVRSEKSPTGGRPEERFHAN